MSPGALPPPLQSLPFLDGWLRLDLLLSLVLASALGALIGWEREVNDKPAGLRTTILICVGAALFTDLSLNIAALSEMADPGRIAAQVVTGIGFLGAGTIIQSRGHVTGLTTAATIWVVAAIGMAAGAKAYVEAIGAALLVLVVLVPLSRLEEWVARRRRSRGLLLAARSPETLDGVLALFEPLGLQPGRPVWGKDERAGAVTLSLEVRGREGAFQRLRERLARMDDIVDVQVP